MTIDRSNPTVAVDIADSSLNDGASTSTVTFTFSEAPVGFAASDIAAVGGTVSGLVATSDPLVYTATFTATDGFAGTGSVSVAAGSYTDTALNAGGAGSDTVAIDRSAPTVTVDIAAGSLSDGDSTSTVTFTFSEAPVGFDAADITAVGGTLSGFAATSDPLVYTATFNATDGFAGAGSVSVAAGGYADRGSATPAAAGSDTVAIDRTNPTVTVDIGASTLSDGDSSSTVTLHLQRGTGRLRGGRHRGGRRHGERPGGDGQSAGLHGDLHGDRRLCRHRLGIGGGGQLHRRVAAMPAARAPTRLPSTGPTRRWRSTSPTAA